MNLIINHSGIARRIISQAVIGSIESGASVVVPALWDTGATNTMISDDVAKALKLKARGSTQYTHVAGVEISSIYVVSIEFQGGLKINQIKLAAMPNIHSFGMLIGMDIISRGKFCIENKNGNTVFSFKC